MNQCSTRRGQFWDWRYQKGWQTVVLCKINSLQEACYAKSRAPTLSWLYCIDIKGVEPAYLRFELDSKQQLSGKQIPPNKWSLDQSGHVAWYVRLLAQLFVSWLLPCNRTSLFVGLVIEFSPSGPPLFSFVEIPRVRYFEEQDNILNCCLTCNLFTFTSSGTKQ